MIIFSKKRDNALDASNIALEENGADCDLRGVSVQREWRLEVWVRESRSGAETALYLI